MRITTALKAVSAIASILVNCQPVEAQPDYYYPHHNLAEYYGRIASERFCYEVKDAKEPSEILDALYKVNTPLNYYLSDDELTQLVRNMMYTHTSQEVTDWFFQGMVYGLNNYNVCKEVMGK